MELRTKVPKSRIIKINHQVSNPSIKIVNLGIEIEEFTINGIVLTMIIPESVEIGKRVNIEIKEVDLEMPSGKLVTEKRTEHLPKLLNDNDVLSISIFDCTALRVLPILARNERRYGKYTGSSFGQFLAILLAAGIEASMLIDAFSNGIKMWKKFRLLEKRNRFEPFDDFCCSLIENYDELTLQDLPGDLFIPVVNAATGVTESICKETKPGFPVKSAVRCALANLLDFVPLHISGDGQETTAFSDDGLLWGFSTFGSICPDLTLYAYYKGRANLNFTTFASTPEIPKKKPNQLKNHKDLSAHYQVDEIGKKLQCEEATSIMPDLVQNYHLISLPEMPVMHYVTHVSQIINLLQIAETKAV